MLPIKPVVRKNIAEMVNQKINPQTNLTFSRGAIAMDR
jgi:hypothetical protein